MHKNASSKVGKHQALGARGKGRDRGKLVGNTSQASHRSGKVLRCLRVMVGSIRGWLGLGLEVLAKLATGSRKPQGVWEHPEVPYPHSRAVVGLAWIWRC